MPSNIVSKTFRLFCRMSRHLKIKVGLTVCDTCVSVCHLLHDFELLIQSVKSRWLVMGAHIWVGEQTGGEGMRLSRGLGVDVKRI